MIKKRLFFTLAVLLSSCYAKAQDNWIKFKADEQVALKFPATPVKLSSNSYMYASKDSSIVLICEIHSQDDQDTDTPSPFEKFMPTTDPSTKDAEPINFTEMKTGNLNGYNYTSSNLILPAKRLSIYTVIIGGKAYMLVALLSKNVDGKVAEEFFSSVMVEKDNK
jgi:hypothetical protein